MGLKFRCSGCNAKLEAEEEWAGMRIACPKCATELIVPSPVSEDVPLPVSTGAIVSPPSPPPPSPPPEPSPESERSVVPEQELPRHSMTEESSMGTDLNKQTTSAGIVHYFQCPECEIILYSDTDISGREICCPYCAETVKYEPRENCACPYCGEEIRMGASFCCHCRKKLDDTILKIAHFTCRNGTLVKLTPTPSVSPVAVASSGTPPALRVVPRRPATPQPALSAEERNRRIVNGIGTAVAVAGVAMTAVKVFNMFSGDDDGDDGDFDTDDAEFEDSREALIEDYSDEIPEEQLDAFVNGGSEADVSAAIINMADQGISDEICGRLENIMENES